LYPVPGRSLLSTVLVRSPVARKKEAMDPRVVILGAGTGGTLTANRLHKELPDVMITVVDDNDRHVYQPGLLFVPFGLADPDDIVRPRHKQLHRGIDYLQSAIERVDIAAQRVHLADGTTLSYDVLVVATGSRLVPEETDGLTGPGWMENVFTFYDLDGATALAAALDNFERGRVVVNVVDLPIKCPVAPLEFCFLADWFFRERGIRDEVDMTYVTPLDGAFTKPTASKTLGGMLEERGIGLVTEFNTGEVDGQGGRLIGYDDRQVPFDLAVVIPVHSGAAYVADSPGLGDALDFVVTDPHTLQSAVAPNIFAIGDAANLPASKAGSVTHFEGEILVENVKRFLDGDPLDASYDGHTNCFIETGFHKAMLIDFNYDTEPVGGHFPATIGVPLLKESRLNHLGKLMFQWFYWHALLPGRDIPGITPDMPLAGKHLTHTTD
jgi:sulfide:quinone oxidoreductase